MNTNFTLVVRNKCKYCDEAIIYSYNMWHVVLIDGRFSTWCIKRTDAGDILRLVHAPYT